MPSIVLTSLSPCLEQSRRVWMYSPVLAGWFAWSCGMCPPLSVPAGPFLLGGQLQIWGSPRPDCVPGWLPPTKDSVCKPGSETTQTFIGPWLAPAHLGSCSLPCLHLKGIAYSFFVFTLLQLLSKLVSSVFVFLGSVRVLDRRQPEIQSWVCTALHF